MPPRQPPAAAARNTPQKRPRPGSSPALPHPAPAAAAVPGASGGIVDNDRRVLEAILAHGSSGVWSQHIKDAAKLPIQVVNKSVKSLVARRLVKVVKDVRYRGRKIYMGAEFEPSPEMTGGSWFRDGALDAVAIDAAHRRCLDALARLRVATVDMLHDAMRQANPSAPYTLEHVREIIQLMLLDHEVEEVRSTGRGEYGSVPVNRVCYRRADTREQGSGSSGWGGMLAALPCGICPRINECMPDGVISPTTCVYFNKYLGLDY